MKAPPGARPQRRYHAAPMRLHPHLVIVVGLTAAALASCSGSGTEPLTTAAASAVLTTTTSTSTSSTTLASSATRPPGDDLGYVGSSDGESLEPLVGVVIAVEANLERVDAFTIRLADGTNVTFVPAPDARFDDGPFSHIRSHLTSGAPVRITYTVLDDGSYLATGAEDA